MGSIEIRVKPELEGLGQVRHSLNAWLEDKGMSEPPRAAFVLATHEALANAIQHSGASSLITVRAQAGPAGIEILISDDGSWKTPDGAANDERGRGLHLIRSLIPEAAVSTGTSGTTVRLNHLVPEQVKEHNEQT